MKTVRDIVSKLEMDATFHKQHSNILIDQALKELEELLLGCKPEKKKIDHSLLSGNQGNIANGGYNQALDDYEKNIKKAIGGK